MLVSKMRRLRKIQQKGLKTRQEDVIFFIDKSTCSKLSGNERMSQSEYNCLNFVNDKTLGFYAKLQERRNKQENLLFIFEAKFFKIAKIINR